MPHVGPFTALLAASGPRIDTDALESAPITCADEGWVGAWGTCPACGTFTVGFACADCLTQAADLHDSLVTGGDHSAAVTLRRSIEANYRPDAVVVVQEGDRKSVKHGAPLRVPRNLRPAVRWVADGVARAATGYLRAGLSISAALRHAALGRDALARDLAAHGHPMDRHAVRYALRELEQHGVITRTGRLATWTDPNEQDGSRVIKSGCRTYALNVELPTISRAALDPLLRLSRSATTPWGKKSARRIEGALRWAVNYARPGQRNALGYWLTRRCIDVGLSEDDAQDLLGRYAAGVDQSGGRYTVREAAATVRSAYRRHA